MRFSGPAGFMAGSIFAVVLTGTTVASAAAAHVLTLGSSNTASRTTTLKAGGHTALSLVSNAGVAPLKVSNTSKVAHLNGDLLDGLDSTAFARSTGQTGEIDVVGQLVDVNNDGTPDVIAAEADCPAGALVTGGGSENFTSSGLTIADGPIKGGWLAISTYDSTTQDKASDFTTNVVCFNPLGAVRGATSLKSAHVTLQQAGRAALNRR